MQYNVAKEGIVEVNTTVGNVSADFDSMLDLMDNTASISVDGPSGDVFCLDVDLGARVAITDIRYYFDSVSASGTVAPTISFLYKNDSIEDFSAGATMSGAGYYYTTVSGISAPRYIRMTHTLSGTSISGTATGFYVMNDDTIVDFGDDGADSYMNIMTAGNTSVIRELAIYNSGGEIADAHVFIEPVASVSEYISVSDSESGPWSGLGEIVVASSDFSSGLKTHYDDALNTSVLNEQLYISDLSSGAGKFTTRIVQKEVGESFSELAVDGTFPSGSALKTDATDGTSTYEVKSNTDKPKDFRFYTHYSWGYAAGNNYTYNRNQYWLENNQSKYVASDGVHGPFRTVDLTGHGEVILPSDPDKGFIFVAYTRRQSFYDYHYTEIARYTNRTRDCTDFWFSTPSPTKVTLRYSSGSPNVIETCRMLADSNDGLWIYYRIVSGGGLTAGYYLRHYTYELSSTYSLFSADKTIYDIDVLYDDNLLWLVDISTASIKKINITGIELYSYDAETLEVIDPRGICATSDGGCWFVNGDYDIHLLDTYADLTTSITDIDVPEELKYVQLDKDDAGFLWLVSSNYISLLQLEGERILFSELMPSEIITVKSYIGGLSLVFDDKSFAFFDKASRTFSATRATSFMVPGVFAKSYSDAHISESYYIGEDLLTGGTVFASSYDGSYPPSNAVDGSVSSMWRATAGSGSWIAYDLGVGNSAVANCMRVQTGHSRSYTLRIQGSFDNVSWDTFSPDYNFDQNTGLYKWFNLYFYNDKAYRYYRVYYVSIAIDPAYMVEMELCKVIPMFPNELDNSWNSKEWKKVSYDSHLLSSDEYKQFRLTMRTDGVADPTIDNIYLYDGVKVDSIYPGTSKSAYIKVDTPVDVTGKTGVHETNVKVWWEIPI
jgi:hypothetical protein